MSRMRELSRMHIQRLNADRERYKAMCQMQTDAVAGRLHLTPLEECFVIRIAEETNADVPEIFGGDANICDLLIRKYIKNINASSVSAI